MTMEFHSTDGFPETAIRLVSGEIFDYADPMSAVIKPHDVAHALARTSRFGGHTGGPMWSVAQHSILVFDIVARIYHQPELGLAALNHDDVEFVTGDWPSPLKRYMKAQGADYKRLLERPIEAAVAKALGLTLDDLHAGVIKDADRLAFVAEGVTFKTKFNPSDQGFDDVDPELVENAQQGMMIGLPIPMVEHGWLNLFYSLSGQPVPEWFAFQRVPEWILQGEEQAPDAEDDGAQS
jgi:5'-deoxynucleotidase YfbR-like HD superfamily hydrolase